MQGYQKPSQKRLSKEAEVSESAGLTQKGGEYMNGIHNTGSSKHIGPVMASTLALLTIQRAKC